MTKSILVTGCTGLLGSNLCFYLRNKFNVIGLSRGVFSMEGVDWVCASFLDLDKMEQLFSERDVDYVIHCAAMTNVDACESDQENAMRINYKGVVDLAKCANSFGSRFIFISTDAVFSGSKIGAYAEIDAVSPINVYGRSKVLAEEALFKEISNFLILRTNMYGFNYLPKKSLAEWVLDSLKDQKQLKMFTDVVFSAMFVNDLCEAIDRAINFDLTGLYHLASADAMSKYEFGLHLASISDLPLLITPTSVDAFAFSASRAKNMTLDSSKFALATKKNLPTMEEGIKKFVQLEKCHYRDRLRGRL